VAAALAPGLSEVGEEPAPRPGEAVVPVEGRGRRLDQAVAELAGVSRAAAARWIEAGRVLVDAHARPKSHRLEGGERVRWEPIEPPLKAALVPERRPLEIRFEDQHLLVVAKPAGLVVHPAAGHPTGTLVNALLGRDDPRLSSGGGPVRPGIVHRLDKDTSGLLLVAKDDLAHAALARDLAARRIERRYLALVQGHLEPDGTVDAPIGRHPRDRKRMAVVAGGRRAVTHWHVRERLDGADLAEVRLETGRTHQIRVHLSSIAHPVAGDRAYGADPRLAQRLRLDRPFLHAWRLAFPHPVSGARLEVEEPLPPDLETALDRARS
ncbi:MAG TPA: RluA family pseudouridine synthase, partial [Actinomycetes bacterium]|nr:RluA family pseudouridine synthase [Actinomycetes bacterium]